MIDWVTGALDLPDGLMRRGGLPCDKTVRITSEGDVVYEKAEWLAVEGSYSDAIRARVFGEAIWVSGSPAKFFQGHNCFGSDDLRGLVVAMYERVLQVTGFPLTQQERTALYWGLVRLTRVDCTAMLEYGTPENAAAVLREIEQHGTLRHRGRGHRDRGTVYFGYRSRRSNVKFYLKGEELAAGPKHALPEEWAEEDRRQVTAYAAAALRCEAMLRGPELNKRGLAHAALWKGADAMTAVNEALEGLQVPSNTVLGEQAVVDLPRRLRATYVLWSRAEDVEQLLSQSTFYRHRRDLLCSVGVDIRIPPAGVEPCPVEVAPLREVLTAKLLGIPEWAYGTPLYFEPKRLEAVS